MADGLEHHWSPEQISRRMLLGFPDNEAMRACHETIYQAIYVQGKGELRKDLAKALRKGRAARRPRNDGQCRRPRFRVYFVKLGCTASSLFLDGVGACFGRCRRFGVPSVLLVWLFHE